MFFETYGDEKNKPLLFLHGFLGSSDDWSAIASQFSEEFHCICVDLPGHGRSVSKNKEKYTMDQTCRILMDLVGSITKKKCNIVSYSMGGRLGYYLAVNYPERFDKIIIESATPGLKSEEERLQRIKNDNQITEKMLSIPFDKFIEFWYSQPIFSTIDKDSDRYAKLISRRLINNPRKLTLSLKMMGTGVMPSLWEKLDIIKAETLLIVGEKDSKFCNIAKDVISYSDKIKITVVEKAGHNVHFEKEEDFIDITKTFLKT